MGAQERAAYYPSLLLAVKERQSLLGKPVVQDPTLDSDTSSSTRRVLSRTAVGAIIVPDIVAWMNDDDSFSDVQFVSRALEDIKARYTECVDPVYPIMMSLIGVLQETALRQHCDGARSTRARIGQITLHTCARRRIRLSVIG